MTINRKIKTEIEYKEALSRIDEIFHAKHGTREGDELELLVILVENYEMERYPISPPDPIEAIKFRMEQQGYTTNDLAKVIGYKSRISEIFHGKRDLTLDMIRNLHSQWNIPLESLIAA